MSLTRARCVPSTASSESDEDAAPPGAPPPRPGPEGRKLQLGGYGGPGPGGTGVSFRTPEQEAEEDARRMRLLRGMQATVVLGLLLAVAAAVVAVVEGSAASGCSASPAAQRSDDSTHTIDTRVGLTSVALSAFHGGIRVLRDTCAARPPSPARLPTLTRAFSRSATQGRPTVTVSVALAAATDDALAGLQTSAELVGTALTVSVVRTAPPSPSDCAAAMVTVKLPPAVHLGPSTTLLATVGEAAPAPAAAWPWRPASVGVVGDEAGAAEEGARAGIAVTGEGPGAPMTFENLSLRAEFGGIRLANVAWGPGDLLAVATAGEIEGTGLSGVETAAAGTLRARAESGGVRLSRVRVPAPAVVEAHSTTGSVRLRDISLSRDASGQAVGVAGSGDGTPALRVVARAAAGDAKVAMASSATALGGGVFDVGAAQGTASVGQARLRDKLGADLAQLEATYGSSLTDESWAEGGSTLDAVSLLSSSTQTPLGSSWTGRVGGTGPGLAGLGASEVVCWSGGGESVAELVVVEELAPTSNDQATATWPDW